MFNTQSKFFVVFKRIVFVLAGLFVIGVAIRIPAVMDKEKTAEQVAKIHATKLTLDDVLGKNLPPDPGAEADKTIAGLDVNGNGIRDDVELAIFKEYPNSAKTRAVLLQYALALQMEMTQPFLNTEVVTAVAEVGDRGHRCVGQIFSRNNLDVYLENVQRLRSLVESKQINNGERKKYQEDFYKNLKSYSSPNESCDLDLATLK